MTKTEVVTVGGVPLEVSVSGDDTPGNPVILLHEGLGSISLWRDFPETLAEQLARRVITYSRQGYGRSAPFSQKRRPDYLHREAIDVLPLLLNELAIENPILFGHSDGASIALIYAGQYPSNCAAVIAAAPHLFVEPVTLAGIREVDACQKEALIARLHRYHNDAQAVYDAWHDIWLDPRFESWNIEDFVAKIRCPVLAIQGRQDQYGTLYQIERIAELNPNTELLVLPDCGHSPHKEKEAEVLSAACRFLEFLD